MNVKIFNNIIKTYNILKPTIKNFFSIYSCGPTVYKNPHLGNMRTYILVDILKKVILFLNFRIKHVMNITDVGHLTFSKTVDKVNSSANLLRCSPWNISRLYEKIFFENCYVLNIDKPSIICRATEHIASMQNMINVLKDKKYSYCKNGNTYFDTNLASVYTKLNISCNKENSYSRVITDRSKKNPEDFVLWFSNSKFKGQIMKWNSPWGIGFPGWHIECSAMALQYLGNKIDIHVGGVDHIPIHHKNEILQSESILKSQWVKHWVHSEFLLVNDKKMGKSNNNFITINDVLKKGFRPIHFRYMCLNTHYSSKLLFNWDKMSESKVAYNHLLYLIKKLLISNQSKLDVNENITSQYKKMFRKVISHDFNTPKSIELIWKLCKDKALNTSEKISLLRMFDQVLSLDLMPKGTRVLSKEHTLLISEREKARKNKNWSVSDEIRNRLRDENIFLEDGKNITKYFFL